MSLTLDLPSPISEELTQDSQREGVSEREHATLLVCLASAFKQGEPHTPFQMAIRDFFSHHALDPEQFFSVFGELVHVCLEVHDAGKLEAPLGNGKTAATIQHTLLIHWRNAIVHQRVDKSYSSLSSDIPPSDKLAQLLQGRISRDVAAEEEESDPHARVHALLSQWQAEDKTPLRSPLPTRQGETPTQALFRKWAEEDAQMTEEEKEAEDELWEEIEKGIEQNRTTLGSGRPAS